MPWPVIVFLGQGDQRLRDAGVPREFGLRKSGLDSKGHKAHGEGDSGIHVEAAAAHQLAGRVRPVRPGNRRSAVSADYRTVLDLAAFECFVNGLSSQADSPSNLGQRSPLGAQINHQSKLTWISSSSLCHRRFGLSRERACWAYRTSLLGGQRMPVRAIHRTSGAFNHNRNLIKEIVHGCAAAK